MLLFLMESIGVPPERTLMIGDTSHDLEMARGARVSALAVSYGAHEEATLQAHSPEVCLPSFNAVLAWLETNA